MMFVLRKATTAVEDVTNPMSPIEAVSQAVAAAKAALVAKRREKAVVSSDLRDLALRRSATTFRLPTGRRDELRAQERNLEAKLAAIDREIAELTQDLESSADALADAQAARDRVVAASIAADAEPIAADILRGLAILVPAVERGIQLHRRVDAELLTGLSAVMPPAARAALTTAMLQAVYLPDFAHLDAAWLRQRQADVDKAFSK
jgi:hypothetical protein